jgi:uncharacterized protein (DUF2062 family)
MRRSAIPRPRTALRDRLRAILQLDDPPPRIALALATGVFIGCTPFWGLQTVLSLAVAVVFRLNRAATLTGTWLNLPWFAPFVYGAAVTVGTLVVPDPGGLRDAWLEFFLAHPESFRWDDYVALFRVLSAALLVGTLVVGGAAALATYAIALAILRTRRPPPGGPGARSRVA